MCTNGKIPNLKLANALMNAHKNNKIYQSTEDVMLWAPSAGGKIRMIASHFRDLAADEDKLEICFKKAWGLQTDFR